MHREIGNPESHWIPGQARNDKLHRTYVVMYDWQNVFFAFATFLLHISHFNSTSSILSPQILLLQLKNSEFLSPRPHTCCLFLRFPNYPP